MTPCNYHRISTVIVTVLLVLVCSGLLVSIASASPLVSGSKDDTHNFARLVSPIAITGKLYMSTAFHVEPFQSDVLQDQTRWKQDFELLQGAYTIQIEPPTTGVQPLESISKSYGKIISRSENMMTDPMTSEEKLTGGTPVNNPDDKKLTTATIDLATTMATELFLKADPSCTLKIAQKIGKIVNILAPIFTSATGERWTVEFDHRTGFASTTASMSSHYITFETFTEAKATPQTGTQNGEVSRDDLVRAGTNPACFTYESGVVVQSVCQQITTAQTFVFVRGAIPANTDPTGDSGATYSFKLAPNGKSCNTSTGEVGSAAAATVINSIPIVHRSPSPQTPTIGNELEQVLDAWGTPAA